MLNCGLGTQRGVILPLVGLALAVLLGFGGLVIDLSGLFVAKTELQSALDSCALAAAAELDGAADGLSRATSAGLTAGNANKVGYQKSSAGILGAEIMFSDTLAGSYSATFTPVANARYARCTHTTGGISAYLIQLVGGPSTNAVGALAVAKRDHAQTACPIPVGLRQRTTTPPNYGYLIGEWVTMLYDPTKTDPSEMGWYNLDGSTNAAETKAEMAGTGYCGAKVGDSVGTPGAKVAIDDQWNSRFGIYKNNGDIATMRPDYTGYAYTSQNWKNAVPQDAYSGAPAAGSDATAANFKTKRITYANYADTDNSSNGVKNGDNITGLDMKGGYKELATSGAGNQHHVYGLNKRIVLVPVIDGGSKIADFACMLMLQPISGPTTTIQLEFLGIAGAVDSPCTSNGLAGGTTGPLVPVLVQ